MTGHSNPATLPLAALGMLRSGYVARAGLVDCGGNTRLRALQARDIAADGSVAWPTLRCVDGVPDSARYRIRDGDLLVPLRAVRFIALVPHDVPDDVIVVGHWGVLTPDPAVADANYLAWYLNHPATAPRLQAAMSGSNISFLSMGALRAFEIDIVSLELQRRIAHADALHTRAIELEAQLADARRRLVDYLTLAALRAEHGPIPESA